MLQFEEDLFDAVPVRRILRTFGLTELSRHRVDEVLPLPSRIGGRVHSANGAAPDDVNSVVPLESRYTVQERQPADAFPQSYELSLQHLQPGEPIAQVRRVLELPTRRRVFHAGCQITQRLVGLSNEKLARPFDGVSVLRLRAAPRARRQATPQLVPRA